MSFTETGKAAVSRKDKGVNDSWIAFSGSD